MGAEGACLRENSIIPPQGKRRPGKPKMPGKASLFICWIGGQLPVQQTISCITRWQSGGFTETIQAGRQKPASPKEKKSLKSQACVTEVSPPPAPIKETIEAPGSGDPCCWGPEVEPLSPLGGSPVLPRPSHKWSSCLARCSHHFYLGSFPEATWQGKQGWGHNGDTVTSGLDSG